MHLLKPEEILRIHDAVIERFGGLKTSSMAPEESLSKAEALVGRIRTAMTYNTKRVFFRTALSKERSTSVS